MEKGTQKILSIILSISILLCFPIAAQAADNSYQETFTGTYTAPETVRNVLVSGNNATISEWYGDRVNISGRTYSVRQNEYGLNKDGNMIEMNLDKTYTVWLAQYGVASFTFTAPTDGKYVFSTSENETYAPYLSSIYKSQGRGLTPTLALIGGTDNKKLSSSSGWNYYNHYISETGEERYDDAQICCSLDAGQTVYLAAGNNHNPLTDTVYDVSVENLTVENCPHNARKQINQKYLGNCTYEYTYQCIWCNEIIKETDEDHDFYREYTHRAVNCLDSSTGMRVCENCGKTEPFTYENDGPHTEASKTIVWIGNNYIDYECVCALCGGTYWKEELSPCYNEETDETQHSFDKNINLSCDQSVVCTKCGYERYGYHDYNYEYTKTPLTESGECYISTWTEKCTKCGDVDIETWTHHRAYEYVQITPQHDNVCGTYNYVCADCGAYMFAAPLTCHSFDVNGVCRRCSAVRPCEHYYDDGVYFAPTCTQDGGTLYTCEYCQSTKVENVVPSTGHNFGNNSPTCLTCGIANPNYVAPTTQPVQPTAQPTTPAPATQPAEAQAGPAGAKKVGKDWVAAKQKNTKVKKVTKAKKSFKATWTKVSGIAGYQVQYSTDKKFKKNTKSVTVKGNKTTSTTVKKLKANKKYYVRIRTYKNVKLNGKTVKVYSKWSSAKTVTTK